MRIPENSSPMDRECSRLEPIKSLQGKMATFRTTGLMRIHLEIWAQAGRISRLGKNHRACPSSEHTSQPPKLDKVWGIDPGRDLPHTIQHAYPACRMSVRSIFGIFCSNWEILNINTREERWIHKQSSMT